MTSTTDPQADFQQQILRELRELRENVDQLSHQVQLSNEKFDKEVEIFNLKFDTYQKGTQWVVQLAFSLIAAATVTVIVSTVLGK